MAIDTRNKRASLLGLALTSRLAPPLPGTALALLGTRQHLAGLYASAATADTAARSPLTLALSVKENSLTLEA